jgi:hypothetical protein
MNYIDKNPRELAQEILDRIIDLDPIDSYDDCIEYIIEELVTMRLAVWNSARSI